MKNLWPWRWSGWEPSSKLVNMRSMVEAGEMVGVWRKSSVEELVKMVFMPMEVVGP